MRRAMGAFRVEATVSQFTGWMIPFSVMMPAISSAGVTSKAGL